MTVPLRLADKILHRILREEFLELAVELRRQRLIVRNDQSRFVELCNDICHGKGLTGAGNTKQSLELVALLKALD